MSTSSPRENPRHRRRKDRSGREEVQQSQPIERQLPIYEILKKDQLELIHGKSLEILGEVGIDFYLEEARQILKEHGARIEGQTAFFTPQLIEKYRKRAPSQFTQLARNPRRNVTIGGDSVVFAPVYGPPFVYDRKHGRRDATLEDFQNFVKLAYLSPYIHHSGGTIVEPTDRPTETRHLDMLYSHIKYSDKPFMGAVMAREHAQDSVRMVEILFGKEAIRKDPALLSLINISSPRRLDDRMLEALTVYARNRQAVIITPFIMAGAMSPVSLAGTLIQQNAEALAGLVYAQMVQPGTPVVYGSFMTNVDLKSGAPVFGSPESQLALLASSQMAQYYDLPFRSGGMFASAKTSDAQSAYESVMTMLPAVLGRVNFVLHAAGWLENGLTAGYEKFLLDCEILGAFHTLESGIDFSEGSLAMESLKEVEPGGHHLGTQHTMERFNSAFYRSRLFDYTDIDTWVEGGSQTAEEAASHKVWELLENYQAPELDQDLDQTLVEYIRDRKEQIVTGE
ncbi:MAG: trimethylamine methyltransferase family protein [Anaerolineales bacterium]